jgi:hypothetical protein
MGILFARRQHAHLSFVRMQHRVLH